MKLKLLAFFLLVLLLGSNLPFAVIAQTNSLEWGVNTDEEFTYVFQRAYFADPAYAIFITGSLPFITDLPVGEKAIMRVNGLDSIPTLINESSQLPLAHCSLSRLNDSVSIAANLTGFVVPIGDWDFMSNLTEEQGLEITETSEEWGTIGTGAIQGGDGSEVLVYIEVRYEKENGTLNYLRYRYTTLGTDIIDVILVNWHVGMPTIVGGDLQLSTILIIAIAGVMGVIIGFLVLQTYRRKKPLVQKLGE